MRIIPFSRGDRIFDLVTHSKPSKHELGHFGISIKQAFKGNRTGLSFTSSPDSRAMSQGDLRTMRNSTSSCACLLVSSTYDNDFHSCGISKDFSDSANVFRNTRGGYTSYALDKPFPPFRK